MWFPSCATGCRRCADFGAQAVVLAKLTSGVMHNHEAARLPTFPPCEVSKRMIDFGEVGKSEALENMYRFSTVPLVVEDDVDDRADEGLGRSEYRVSGIQVLLVTPAEVRRSRWCACSVQSGRLGCIRVP